MGLSSCSQNRMTRARQVRHQRQKKDCRARMPRLCGPIIPHLGALRIAVELGSTKLFIRQQNQTELVSILSRRDHFTANRTAALNEWRGLCAA